MVKENDRSLDPQFVTPPDDLENKQAILLNNWKTVLSYHQLDYIDPVHDQRRDLFKNCFVVESGINNQSSLLRSIWLIALLYDEDIDQNGC